MSWNVCTFSIAASMGIDPKLTGCSAQEHIGVHIE